MGISFGSTGIKPYVGSKEVKEAYVGSQLVYRAGLPYYYYFLGGTEKYQISDNCLLQDGATIAKPSGVTNFMLSIKAQNRIRLNGINSFAGYSLKFTTCAREGYDTNKAQVIFYTAGGGIASYTNFNYYAAPTLVSIPIPSNAVYAILKPNGSNETFYFDMVRCEEN